MERDNNIIEILRKAYTEGYIAGIEGDEPKLGELSERQLLTAIKQEYEKAEPKCRICNDKGKLYWEDGDEEPCPECNAKPSEKADVPNMSHKSDG